MRQYEMDLLTFMRTQRPEIGADIVEQKEITEENEAKLQAALDEFNQMWVGSGVAGEGVSSGDSA
jgi:plasmid maintenance system antidote protein VapI